MENNPHHRISTLRKFWERIKHNVSAPPQPPDANEVNQQIYYLSQAGIGTEEALTYLYTTAPSFETFMDWVDEAGRQNAVSIPPHNGTVLTSEDHKFWNDNGYLVIKNAVPAGQCSAAQDAIWAFLGASPADAGSWYLPHPGKKGLMLSFFQHHALNINRNSAIIRKIYEELYKSTDIYLLVDKVSFNPPETPNFNFKGSALHWDVSLKLPIPFELQGLLYLNDVAAGDGAFHCVPGFHNRVDQWMASLSEHSNPREAALEMLKPIAIPGNAGDLVIWHQALPHCASPNKGTTPRMVQYIAYKPIVTTEQSVWI